MNKKKLNGKVKENRTREPVDDGKRENFFYKVLMVNDSIFHLMVQIIYSWWEIQFTHPPYNPPYGMSCRLDLGMEHPQLSVRLLRLKLFFGESCEY
jgi:hypothetical protein